MPEHQDFDVSGYVHQGAQKHNSNVFTIELVTESVLKGQERTEVKSFKQYNFKLYLCTCSVTPT